MIPPFLATGLLPPSANGEPYETTADEVRQRFVDDLGAPAWRAALFDGWDLLRRGVARFAPSARWWLWGCFISSHMEPLFGEHETVQAVVLVPVVELPTADDEIALYTDFLRGAQERHRVDVTAVYEYPLDSDDRLEALDQLEFKWRPRATVGIADHRTKVLVPAGFVEVHR